LRDTDLAAATLGQIRFNLFKIGTRITISCRRIHLELDSALPYRKFSGAPVPTSARRRRAEGQKAFRQLEKARRFPLIVDPAQTFIR